MDALLAQWEGEDPAVEEELGRRLFASVPAQLTGMGGSLRLAASSVLSAGDCFVLQGLQEPQMYPVSYTHLSMSGWLCRSLSAILLPFPSGSSSR